MDGITGSNLTSGTATGAGFTSGSAFASPSPKETIISLSFFTTAYSTILSKSTTTRTIFTGSSWNCAERTVFIISPPTEISFLLGALCSILVSSITSLGGLGILNTLYSIGPVVIILILFPSGIISFNK